MRHFLLLILPIVIPLIAHAQPTGKASELPIDKTAAEKFAKAQQAIQKKDWKTAVTILQRFLTYESPGFLPVERTDNNGKKYKVFVNVRVEADRLIGTLPKEGLSAYQLLYEPKAKELLKEWEQGKYPNALLSTMRDYPHTVSGKQALRQIAICFLIQKQFTQASLCFDRYFRLVDPAQEIPELLLHAIFAYHSNGDAKSEAMMWKHLRPRIEKDGIRWNEKQWTLKQIEAHVAEMKVPTPEFDGKNWPMLGGNRQRNGQTQSRGMPNWKPVYSQNLFKAFGEAQNEALAKLLNREIARTQTSDRPLLPEAVPVVAVGTFRRKAFPLVVYRTGFGTGATNLNRARLRWHSVELDWALGALHGESGVLVEGPTMIWTLLAEHQARKTRPDLLFANSMTGSVTIHRGQTYNLDDLPALSPRVPDERNWRSSRIPLAEKTSRLINYDFDSGKFWNAFGGSSKRFSNQLNKLRDHVFLATPFFIDDAGYTLVQKRQDLHLASLNPQRDEVLQNQFLTETRYAINEDFRRRLEATHPAYDEGILVCPSNDGKVFGVDPLTLTPQWLYPYEQTKFKDVDPEKLPEPWHYCCPMIAKGKIVFTAPDDREHVHCVELKTGRLLWKVKRKKDLYLANIINDQVLMIGEASCRALSLSDGKELWQIETGLPSGRGVASQDVYYLPLKSGVKSKKPEIIAIDVAQKKIVERSIAENDEVPGNLLFYGDKLISQTALYLKVYALKK